MQFMLITAVRIDSNNKILPQSCVGEFCMALTYRGKVRMPIAVRTCFRESIIHIFDCKFCLFYRLLLNFQANINPAINTSTLPANNTIWYV